jgi:flagellar motor switch protein FliM
VASKVDAMPASLLRERDEAPGFPGLDRIGERLARGLRDVIAAAGGKDARITRNASTLTSFGAWRAEQAGFGALCRYQLAPIKGDMLMAIPPALIVQLVDLFYGGTGELSFARAEFTAAESRYVTRFAEQCRPLLTAAWADVATINPVLLGMETDITNSKLGKDVDLVLIQPFVVKIGSGDPLTLTCVYPVAALRPIAALSDTPPSENAVPADPIWRDRLSDAVLEVRLPMRSIFARPELPLGQLLSLKAGDVIPVCLPNHIPITVAGRLFAQGTVGESSGRAAIKIEKIEQGTIRYE